jgi:hypothetical protein
MSQRKEALLCAEWLRLWARYTRCIRACEALRFNLPLLFVVSDLALRAGEAEQVAADKYFAACKGEPVNATHS